MTTMHRDRNWKIQMFGREHGVPHFHVWTPNAAAVIAIETLAVLSGAIDANTLEEARAWADAHRVELLTEWRRLNPGKNL
jgi:Domain of unknown function (DUF4160)